MTIRFLPSGTKVKKKALPLLNSIWLIDGANWLKGEVQGKCTSCMEYKALDYAFLSSNKVFTAECVDCMADHF